VLDYLYLKTNHPFIEQFILQDSELSNVLGDYLFKIDYDLPNDNMNNGISVGCFAFGSNTENRPIENSYGSCLVWRQNSGRVLQMAFTYNSLSGCYLYIRALLGINWTSWAQIAYTSTST